MERILIEIRGGVVVNTISTTPNIQIEFLDYDLLQDGGELIHFVHVEADEIKASEELDHYIQKEITDNTYQEEENE